MKKGLIFKTGALLTALLMSVSVFASCGRDRNSAEPSAEASSSAKEGGETTVSHFNAENADAAHSPSAHTQPPAPENPGSADSAKSTQSSPDEKTEQSKNGMILSDAESFFGAGMYDDAREMLASVDTGSLSDAEIVRYIDLKQKLDKADTSESSDFTPQEAIKIVEDMYGVDLGDNTDGLALQTDSAGEQYYQIQVRLDNENRIVTVNIYKNGLVSEISNEVISYG